MKLRSLIVAGAALSALAVASPAQAATTNDTVNATVLGSEVTLAPTASTPMVLARGLNNVDGVTALVATSTSASFNVTGATTTDATYGDGKMHQCSVAGGFTALGKTLTDGIEYAKNTDLGTLATASTTPFGTGSNSIISNGVGAATTNLKWHQPLEAADAILATENYCFKITYTIT